MEVRLVKIRNLKRTMWMGCGVFAVMAFTGSAGVPPLLNYQGRVVVHGTNYHGDADFKFALLGGKDISLGASAVANVNPGDGSITSIDVPFGGFGYVSVPAVEIQDTGPGSGAVLQAVVEDSRVTRIDVLAGGSGYMTPSVLVGPPDPVMEYASLWSHDGTSVTGAPPATVSHCVSTTAC